MKHNCRDTSVHQAQHNTSWTWNIEEKLGGEGEVDLNFSLQMQIILLPYG